MEEQRELKTFKDLLYEVILPKVELISLIILGIAILLKFLKAPGVNQIIMISLSTFAGTAYLKAFSNAKITSWVDKFLQKTGAISSSVLIIGILFFTLKLPGSIEMLTIGSFALSISVIVIFIKFLLFENDFHKKLLIQHAKTIAIVIGVYLLNFINL